MGHSGGMRLNLLDSVFEVESIDRGQYFLSVNYLHRSLNKSLTVIGIYEPTNHAASPSFLDKVSTKVV